ncbi:MAG: DUF4340 domain-containing protein [Desulfovibrionaceae bacterium]
MNKRITLLVLLAAVVWAVVSFWPKPTGRQAPDPSWPAPTPATLGTIAVNASDGSFVLTHREGAWYAGPAPTALDAHPALNRADTAKVEALAAFIGHNKPVRRLGDVPDRLVGEFGLDKPGIDITITGNTAWRLSLGRENPTKDGVYAFSSLERQLLLLDAKYRSQLGRGVEYYYDLRLMDVPVAEVERVRVDVAGTGAWEMSRAKDGYVFTEPKEMAEAAVAAREMDEYLNTITTMTAGRFMDTAPALLPAPLATISVWRKGVQKPVVVDMFALEPKNGDKKGKDGKPAIEYAGRSTWQGLLFTLDKERVDKLARAAFTLRERKVADVAIGEVARQRLTRMPNGHPGSELWATKADSGWIIESSGRDVVGMDMLMWRLTDLKSEADPVDAQPQSATHALTWELLGADNKPEALFRFYLDPNLPKGRCWLQVGDTERFHPVADKLLEDLQALMPAREDPAHGGSVPETPNPEPTPAPAG